MDSKRKWNEKYLNQLKEDKVAKCNENLAKLSTYFSGGKAIDLACGLGGNSIFLAQLGFHVTAVDISDVAIHYVQEQAKIKNLSIEAFVSDLTSLQSLQLDDNKFDLAVITYYLDRNLFPFVTSIVRKGGYIFIETFYKTPLLGEKNKHVSDRYKLCSNELLDTFKSWQILYFEENEQEGIQTIFARKIRGR